LGVYDKKAAAITQQMAEKKRQKLNGRELAMLELLVMLHGMLKGRGTRDLEGLMRRASPRGWMRYRQALGILDKLLDDVYAAIPLQNLKMIDNMMRNGEIGIKLRRAGAYDDDMTVVPVDGVRVLLNTCLHAECAMCLKDRADIKRCTLRKAMDAINPPESFETTSCVYRDVVIRSETPGKYI